MKFALDIPWYQYGLIVMLADKLEEKKQWFGKTALQKFVYLLETIYKVPCGYQFSLYIHGPFCGDLMADLDYVNTLKGVFVNFDRTQNGYKISRGTDGEILKEKAKDFLTQYSDQIYSLIEDFGSMRTKDLELRSTLVYVDRDISQSGRNLSRREFVQEIKGVKPHFSEAQIESALSELESKGFVWGRYA